MLHPSRFFSWGRKAWHMFRWRRVWLETGRALGKCVNEMVRWQGLLWGKLRLSSCPPEEPRMGCSLLSCLLPWCGSMWLEKYVAQWLNWETATPIALVKALFLRRCLGRKGWIPPHSAVWTLPSSAPSPWESCSADECPEYSLVPVTWGAAWYLKTKPKFRILCFPLQTHEPNTCREEGLPYFCLNLPCHTWLLKEEDTVGFIKLGMRFSLSKQWQQQQRYMIA